MILLSVGTQLPFDRLVVAVDRWAVDHREREIVAQIGPGVYLPAAMRHFPFVGPEQFRVLQEQCQVMVSHAGIGSMIAALRLGKPIIVLAREYALGEHRNDHQLSTIARFTGMPGIYPARDGAQLAELLDRADELRGGEGLAPHASAQFTDRLRAELDRLEPVSGLRLLMRGGRR